MGSNKVVLVKILRKKGAEIKKIRGAGPDIQQVRFLNQLWCQLCC